MIKWVCKKYKTHIFNEETESGCCSICPPYDSLLIPVDLPDSVETLEHKPRKPEPPVDWEIKPPDEDEEVGFCVILMDASSSMTDIAFEGIPLTRMRLVANSAASGIFDLKRMQNNRNFYVDCYKFDDRIDRMFLDSVANIIATHKTIEAFADYLYKELFSFQQGTDINQALGRAHTVVRDFLGKELADFPAKEYTPMLQRVINPRTNDGISIPNVRVLIYTDGMQYVNKGSNVLNPNPFKQNIIEELNHDILIAAYFGNKSDKGCQDLQKLVSNCPKHGIPQFFIFDDPSRIGELKYLFRMASGASGFCPRCLE